MLQIPGRMPGFNEMLKAKGAMYQGGRSGYTGMKRRWAETIRLLAESQGFGRVTASRFTYLFREPSRRRDPSNVYAGVKFIEDALQEAGLLDGDGWRQVDEIRCHHILDKDDPGVTVFVGAATLNLEQALEFR